MNTPKISMQPVGFSALPDINDVKPLSLADESCLSEVRAVLEKHGTLDRFGLALLHDHFPVRDDELLVEFADPENRQLISRVVSRSEVASTSVVETVWRLGSGEARRVCEKVCSINEETRKHKKTGHLPLVDNQE